MLGRSSILSDKAYAQDKSGRGLSQSKANGDTNDWNCSGERTARAIHVNQKCPFAICGRIYALGFRRTQDLRPSSGHVG
jgi:hypothetical protein